MRRNVILGGFWILAASLVIPAASAPPPDGSPTKRDRTAERRTAPPKPAERRSVARAERESARAARRAETERSAPPAAAPERVPHGDDALHDAFHGRHSAKDLVIEDLGDRIRVETVHGDVVIREIIPASPGGDPPYPRCLDCHGDLENIAFEMGGFELDCTFCHGGDPDATLKELAHVFPNGNVVYDQTVPPLDDDLAYQKFLNPSNLRVVGETCGLCHYTPTHDIHKSMMATAAGHYAGGLYQNGVVDTKTPVYGTFAVTDDDGYVPIEKGAVESLLDLLVYTGGDPEEVATHFAAVPSQACARCHLWSRGKGYRGAIGAEGVYRADGCAACHMLYDNDGLSRSADASIDHAEPGHPKHHVVTRHIPSEQCIHCHHRGARIGLSFSGRAQMPPRLPSGPGVAGTTNERFNGNFHYAVHEVNPQDVHAEAGMHCIDCHTALDVMGDGNIYGHMDQAVNIECVTCHGLPDAFPTLVDESGYQIWNVRIEEGEGQKDDRVVLTSKVTGAEHEVPLAMDAVAANPYAACAMDGNHLRESGGLECYACHASWVPNCFGCHFERDERFTGLNFMTRQQEVGRVRTNDKIFESFRHFALGPNSEGKVGPYVVACHPIADVTAADGTKILDNVMPETVNGLSGLAHNPVNPHTTRGPGDVRSCAECHRAPPSMGFGSGNYAVGRRHVFAAGAVGVARFDQQADPQSPDPDGTLPGTGGAVAMTSIPNVVHGTTDYLVVARGPDGVLLHDLRDGALGDPLPLVADVNAIDVARVARYLYVVDAGTGVRIYDHADPTLAAHVATLPIPGALRVVPWGIHLLVAAGTDGLYVVDVADHDAPNVVAVVPDIDARDVRPYAHYQPGRAFAVRAYVADPGYGVRMVDLLPDYDDARVVGGVPLPGALALDAYTRYVDADGDVPSLEHDYLYVAAGAAGLHVLDMTAPDAIVAVAVVAAPGGFATDVDVASRLAPPGTDDYAVIADAQRGLVVVDVTNPRAPIDLGAVPGAAPATRVFVEVQQLDRFLDEQGTPLKENSHPFTGTFDHATIVRLLRASIDCDTEPADIDGDGTVGFDDLLVLLGAWGPCPPPPAECAADVDGDGIVGATDLVALLAAWSD